MSGNTPKTILIADDDQFIVRAFRVGLERYDYTVVIAENGEVAIEQIAAVLPDLVLLDLIMPKKDGFEVLRTIKADPGLAHIPIVVLTSLGQASDERTARDYGAADFLVKSQVSLNDILLRVERLLEETAEATAAAVQSVKAAEAAVVSSSVPELPDSEAAVIAESIRSEAEEEAETDAPAESAEDSAPQSTVPDLIPDLTQPVPVEVAAEETPESRSTEQKSKS